MAKAPGGGGGGGAKPFSGGVNAPLKNLDLYLALLKLFFSVLSSHLSAPSVCAYYVQEGPGPCIFCGSLIFPPDEEKMLAKDSKKAQKIKEKLIKQFCLQVRTDIGYVMQRVGRLSMYGWCGHAYAATHTKSLQLPECCICKPF